MHTSYGKLAWHEKLDQRLSKRRKKFTIILGNSYKIFKKKKRKKERNKQTMPNYTDKNNSNSRSNI